MRYRAIQEHDRRDPIRLMGRALAGSPAGSSAWRDRPESRRATAHRTLLSTIRVIHGESRATYGSPSIWNALVKQGPVVGTHRIARRMRAEGIRAKTVKTWRAPPPLSHRLPVATGLLSLIIMWKVSTNQIRTMRHEVSDLAGDPLSVAAM